MFKSSLILHSYTQFKYEGIDPLKKWIPHWVHSKRNLYKINKNVHMKQDKSKLKLMFKNYFSSFLLKRMCGNPENAQKWYK